MEVTLMGDFAAFLGAVTIVGYILVGRELRSNRGMPIFVYAFPVTMGAGIWCPLGHCLFEGSSFPCILNPRFRMDRSLWIVWVGYCPSDRVSAGIRALTRYCDGYPDNRLNHYAFGARDRGDHRLHLDRRHFDWTTR